MDLITSVGGLIFLSTWNFMLCYFTTSATINAMLVGDRIYELNWYEKSRNEQFMVQVMIQRAQKPFDLKGLGVFVCSLETYLKVKQISPTLWIRMVIFIFYRWFELLCRITWYSVNCKIHTDLQIFEENAKTWNDFETSNHRKMNLVL